MSSFKILEVSGSDGDGPIRRRHISVFNHLCMLPSSLHLTSQPGGSKPGRQSQTGISRYVETGTRSNLRLSAEKDGNSDQHDGAAGSTAIASAPPVKSRRSLVRVRGDNGGSRCAGGIAGGIGIDGDSAGSHDGARVIARAGNRRGHVHGSWHAGCHGLSNREGRGQLRDAVRQQCAGVRSRGRCSCAINGFGGGNGSIRCALAAGSRVKSLVKSGSNKSSGARTDGDEGHAEIRARS
ncbi:hypothetical protein PG988_008267 [Apiospora saccharicola]